MLVQQQLFPGQQKLLLVSPAALGCWAASVGFPYGESLLLAGSVLVLVGLVESFVHDLDVALVACWYLSMGPVLLAVKLLPVLVRTLPLHMPLLLFVVLASLMLIFPRVIALGFPALAFDVFVFVVVVVVVAAVAAVVVPAVLAVLLMAVLFVADDVFGLLVHDVHHLVIGIDFSDYILFPFQTLMAFVPC